MNLKLSGEDNNIINGMLRSLLMQWQASYCMHFCMVIIFTGICLTEIPFAIPFSEQEKNELTNINSCIPGVTTDSTQ